MNFNDWLKDSDSKVQDAVNKNLDRAFDGSNKRKTNLFPHYLNYKILQENKKLVRATWFLVIITWFLAIVTIILNLK